MVSNTIQFVYNNKIVKLKNPDPNRTILEFIRSFIFESKPTFSDIASNSSNFSFEKPFK